MTETDRRPLLFLLALVAALAGVTLRLWHVAAEPLWLDEAYSAYAAAKGFDFLWTIVPLYETHPPFYYSLLRVWTLPFGDGLVALRALGLACGIATLPAAAFAAREIGRYLGIDARRQGLLIALAVILAAFAPMLIEMARQVRPYPVMILVVACQTGMLFRLGRTGHLTRPAYAGYLALFALTLWLHNLGVLYGAATGLAFLLLAFRRDWSRADWIAFFGGHALVALVWAPAILILADQAPTWMRSTWLVFNWRLLDWGMGALWAVPLRGGQAAAGVLVVLALVGLARLGKGWRAAGALLLLAILPVALAVAISMTLSPVFIPRTMTGVTVPACLLIALGVVLCDPRLRIVSVGALLFLLVQMVTYDVDSRQTGTRYDWYGAVNWVAKRFGPGDQVFAYPNEGALPFRLAVRDLKRTLPTRPIPTDMPTLDGGPGAWNPTGSRGVFSLPRARLETIAAAPDTRAVPTVWLLRLGPWAYDKGDNFLHALQRDRVEVGRFRSGPIDIVGLRRKDLAPVAAAEQAKP